ncbi:YeiH family protein [Dehalobacterium formicoaceticum]|uniref:Sulfate exporter family transporter n=1 Tax=Dehalobacterium formicoaceticum TaxID=51515 RepID=A0ABT1Y5A0_9FIRM|nr:putative sulfate exporter family transporter [Dehalobacterium formicoaceticum]MCR6546060.1 putative sulfate exporter family transporter [Dehalobacterium formicoaceticum]
MEKLTVPSGKWSDLWQQEDYWAVWIGLVIVLAAILFRNTGNSFLTLLVFIVPDYSDPAAAISYVQNHMTALFALYLFFMILFAIAVKAMGHRISSFIAGFTVLFVMSAAIIVWGSWSLMENYGLETPLLALIVGLLIGNILKVPKGVDNVLHTGFFVKTGIVLTGATLPFTLIMMAGVTAFAQASIVTSATFLTVYWAGTRLFSLDKRFAATLAAGGSICGVSAAIAIGGAIKAEKQHVSIAISVIIIWSILMIFLLPFAINVLDVPPGPAGAWIGTSEFADAPGMVVAAAIDEQAIKTFTLVKVIGRDMFIGIWCFIMALFSITRWDKRFDGTKPNPSDIWIRFPKFILGFFVASILITILTAVSDVNSYNIISNNIISLVEELRNWTFIFAFLSIGLTSRLKDLTFEGWKPFAAIGIGVLVNIPIAYLLSVVIMGSYWAGIK